MKNTKVVLLLAGVIGVGLVSTASFAFIPNKAKMATAMSSTPYIWSDILGKWGSYSNGADICSYDVLDSASGAPPYSVLVSDCPDSIKQLVYIDSFDSLTGKLSIRIINPYTKKTDILNGQMEADKQTLDFSNVPEYYWGRDL